VATGERCPNCGAETTSGQNVCIECGHDLRRTYGRAPYTRAWIAAAIVAVLAIGVGAGFALGSLTNDKQKKEARQVSVTSSSNSVPAATAIPPAALHQPTAPVTPTPTTPSTAPTTPTTPPPTTPPATATPPPSNPSPPTASSGVASWPAGKSAYTLVLISAKSRKQAYAKAREAKSRGIDAGVLHSNNFSSLNPGYWVVFVGQYKTVGQARSHIDEYASKGFPGGYPRQIKK
jgi:type IV secretory pathway VirB10-like protein